MTNKLKFNCGCSFDITKEFTDGRQPLVDFDIDKINYNCPETWKIFAQGLTAGVFQLESRLGKHYSKELKPESLEHLFALGAILRPGTLDARDDKGVSMTQHYCNKKNGTELIEPFHPVVDKTLGVSYGIIIYQEQFMKLAADVADFDKKEVDRLRKASGKKDQQEMSDIMKVFKEKATKKGLLPEEQIDKLIENIKKTARYSFNKAHSDAYGRRCYKTAYFKAHFPLAFYTAKLKGAKFRVDGDKAIQELIDESKLFNIETKGPDLRSLRKFFYTDGHVIKFGLSDIKGVGESSVKKIKTVLEKYEFSDYFDFCINVALPCLSDSIVIKLIEAGALDFFKLTRSRMLAEYKLLAKFNDNERGILFEKVRQQDYRDIPSLFKDVAKLKKEGGVFHSAKRLELLQSEFQLFQSPISPYHDNPIWITHREEDLLKYNVTCQKIDACDTSLVNTSCKDFIAGKDDDFMIFGVNIRNVEEKVIRRGDNVGKKFCSLKIFDSSSALDAVCWPEVYESYGEILTEGNSVIIQGGRSRKKKELGNLIVYKAWQAK